MLDYTGSFVTNEHMLAIQFSAHSMAACMAVKQLSSSTWPYYWDVEASPNNQDVSLLFQIWKLFADTHEPFLVKSRENKRDRSLPIRNRCQKVPLRTKDPSGSLINQCSSPELSSPSASLQATITAKSLTWEGWRMTPAVHC